MRKVLHIIDFMDLGGAEKLVASTLFELGGYENHLIILYQPKNELPLPPHVKKSILGFKSVKDLWRAKNFIKKYISENGIELVHAHLYWSNVISRMAVPATVPLFNTIHAISSEACYKINRFLLYLEKFTYKKRHTIIAVSNEVLKDFDQWVGLKGHSAVIYNIIDDRFFSYGPKKDFGEPGGPLKLVATGNLREQKNYPYLLQVFKELPRDISLDIFGEGHLRNSLQAEIDTCQLNVKLCGQVSNLPDLLPQYHLFVMSSHYEGFSLGLMEAMACGLPAYISNVPVLREAGGDCAVYFDISNSADLVSKLKSLREDRSVLPGLSVKGQERAKALTSKEVYLGKIRNLYEQAMKS